MDFTNKKMEGLHGRNVFNVGIDATKVVKVVRLSQHNNFIVKGVYPKASVCVDRMNMIDLHDRPEVMRSD